MSAPKSVKAKAVQLAKELDRVSQLAEELEAWIASKEGYEVAHDLFCMYRFDNPYEFNLESTIEMLDRVAEG